MKKNRESCCVFKLICLKIAKLLLQWQIPKEMKKGMAVMMFVLAGGLAYGQGIDFREISLDEALAQAKKEKKYVFMDCYTYWCGPCKNMERNVFSREEVGAYFNSTFVCVKYDLAQEEWKWMKEKYDIQAVPTYLILSPDGTVYHKVVGGRSADVFIELFKQGMNKKNSLSYLEDLHRKGKIGKDELLRYAGALREARDKREAGILDELLTRLTDKEKVQAKYWSVFKNKEFGNEDYHFVVANLDAFQKNVGKEIVDDFFQKSYGQLTNYYMVRLQNGTLKDFSEPRKKVQDAREELNGIDIKGKKEIAESLGLLTAYLEGDKKEVVEYMGRMFVADDENLRVAYFFINIMRTRKDKEMMAEMVRSKDRLLAQAIEITRGRLTKEIDAMAGLI